MSIHILVPQERLVELLKKEVFSDFASGSTSEDAVRMFEGVAEATKLLKAVFWFIGPNLENERKLTQIEEAFDAGELANYLGYEYTVDTDAGYFESLEDMLGGEE